MSYRYRGLSEGRKFERIDRPAAPTHRRPMQHSTVLLAALFCFVTAGCQQNEKRPPPRTAPELPAMSELDRDGNGEVAPNEVTEDRWLQISRADINKDGVITKAELEGLKAARKRRTRPGES